MKSHNDGSLYNAVAVGGVHQIHGYKSCILKERKALLKLKDYLISKSSESLVGSVLKARPEEPDLEYGEAIPVLSNYETWTNDKKSDCCRWNGIKCNRYKSLRRLRNLEILDVSWNDLSNSIFPFLNAATSLTTLFLRGNFRDGPFPIKGVFSICHDPFPGLAFVSLCIMAEFSHLKKLKALDLSLNNFSGSMELQELGNLKNFELLNLSGNRLHGFISELTNLPKLELLNLARNNFSGPITGVLKKLRVLDLSSNQFSGNLPSGFSSLESLEYLSLLNNNFSSLFSLNPLTNLTNLKVFKVSSTSDKVQVESEGNSEPKFQLRVAVLRSCSLEKIPSFLVYQKNLRLVDLSSNRLSGNPP
ncbi:unnamed protein product, partial [Brassica oleracea]